MVFKPVNETESLAVEIGVANNGGGTDGIEYTFPAEAATAGSFILIGRDSAQARIYFGKDIDYNAGSTALGYNGDDAFELFYNDVLIDVYGDQNADGSGLDWDYLDGWAHRKNGKTLSSTFNTNDWEISGINVTDDLKKYNESGILIVSKTKR